MSTIFNDNFIDFVNFQMEKNLYLFKKVDKYKKYNKEFSKINENIEKITNEEEKKLIEKLIDCYEKMSLYENAFAYYLGMKQGLNMSKLE